jgi:hypothetical protein
MRQRAKILLATLLVVVGVGAVIRLLLSPQAEGIGSRLRGALANTYTIERTDYAPPQPSSPELLADDRLEDKKTAFDPTLVDRREHQGWLINKSEALTRLDVPLIKPDQDAKLLVLHPSYALAIQAALAPDLAGSAQLLASVNLIDGKAKQFDDGLYAALDQAYYQGLNTKLPSHVDLIHRLFDRVGPESPAAPYLAAGLEFADVKVDVKQGGEKAKYLVQFLANQVRSKPIGFYTWNPTLEHTFRFLRFFQQPLGIDTGVPRALADALTKDQTLLEDYRRAIRFYDRLSNPRSQPSVIDLIDKPGSLSPKDSVALFPPSRSREQELFGALFPNGLPPDADLMRAFVERIRSGKISLVPKPDSGWYDYQVYALETLLLPEKGEEHDKLLLTKAYKTRMLEAFKAMMTKRRETHIRDVEPKEVASAAPPLEKTEPIRPIFRLEPSVTYYLRTARSYAFLARFLDATLGQETLKSLRGLREGAPREEDLASELPAMRDLFYGFALLSAEDLGMRLKFLEGEEVDLDRCERLANNWLAQGPGGLAKDPDLARDTRVGVPVLYDAQRKATRLWLTIGVRLTRLETEFVRPPRLKPKEGSAEWTIPKPHLMASTTYLIPVDEFAEVELKGARVLTREELRSICDTRMTKEAIVEALRK